MSDSNEQATAEKKQASGESAGFDWAAYWAADRTTPNVLGHVARVTVFGVSFLVVYTVVQWLLS